MIPPILLYFNKFIIIYSNIIQILISYKEVTKNAQKYKTNSKIAL